LRVDLDAPIATATGFGYEWVHFDGAEQAWQIVVESIDRGLTLSGHDWENILFAGYREGELPSERLVYAMADGPEYYSRWITWDAFREWVDRATRWGCTELGRHSRSIATLPACDVARGVMEKLVAWSDAPPGPVRNEYPDAAFGLAGIGALADYLEQLGPDDDWMACHQINPQWTVRNATSVYLNRLVDHQVFSSRVNVHISEAAAAYRAAYECWQAAYALYGHATSEQARREPRRRAALVAIVRAWYAHEERAVAAVARAAATV
jgi:hypothetical protein